jgi:hypothetical protein
MHPQARPPARSLLVRDNNHVRGRAQHHAHRQDVGPFYGGSAAGDSTADPIQEVSDKVLATFSSKRKLLLDLGKDAFYEHAWKVKCVDTILRDGRVYVTLETIAGQTPAPTTQEQGKRFDMPVSRGKDLHDTNLCRAIELCMPGVHTMQGLLLHQGQRVYLGPEDRHY